MKTVNTRSQARALAAKNGGKVLDSHKAIPKGDRKEFIGMENGKAVFRRWAVKS